jgi:2-polyprenyl-3-methyl-5-hydroxy-6-metoxy-1,4-benzoquinol methylase
MTDGGHKYQYDVALLDDRWAPAKVARMVGRKKRVLDLGAGPGSIARILKHNQDCRVTAVDIDESVLEALSSCCEHVYQCDLNDPGWIKVVSGTGPFDIVIAADVLEHLYDPWAMLRSIDDVLAPDGSVVASIPNTGHNSVLACLLRGDFEYRNMGLLDATHIRFFGIHNIERLFTNAGLKIIEAEFVIVRPEDSFDAGAWNKLSLPMRACLEENQYGTVYQVVLKARPDPARETGLSLVSIPVQTARSSIRLNASSKWRRHVGGLQFDTQMAPKLIAFYLPQFHPIPENDQWWGKGFTEWTNVTKATPLFTRHYQPHLPADLGFYDLRVRQTRRDQIRAAKAYGIDGFCYHYYWFSGKRLLNGPVDDMLTDPESDMPFCLCWANETWTRKWDGGDHEVLIAQTYRPEDSLAFIEDLIPFFSDPRYIHIDGAPLLIIYQPQCLPASTVAVWREYCERRGIGTIHLCAALTFQNTEYSGLGFDSGVEYPPHNMHVRNVSDRIRFHQPFSGWVWEYEEIARSFLERATPDRNVFMTVFPSWDNTARTGHRARIVLNGTPGNFEYWLAESIRRTRQHFPAKERFVFINAWNEWAEGCHLEPDRKYGSGFLEATLRAKSGLSNLSGFHKSEDSTLPPGSLRSDLVALAAFHRARAASRVRSVAGYQQRLVVDRLRLLIRRHPRIKKLIKQVISPVGSLS